MLIRKATLNDIDFIRKELKAGDIYYNTKYKLSEASESYQKEKLEMLINTQVFLIAEIDYIPVGYILAVGSKHFFNPDIRKLDVLLWWVKEEYRKTRAGYLLLKTVVKFGKENFDWIWLDVNVDAQIKNESLEKLGFKNKEKTYLMEM